MSTVWNSLFAAFKDNFFSKGFWLGSFLPIALFTLLHVLIAALQFPETVQLWHWLQGPQDVLALLPAVFAMLIVMAYASSPLIPLFMSWLDGSGLPERLNDVLRRQHKADTREALQIIDDAERVFSDWTRVTQRHIHALQQAREAGMALGNATDVAVVTTAAGFLPALRRIVDRQRFPDEATLQAAVDAMVTALTRNAASLPDGHADEALAHRLTLLHQKMSELLIQVEDDACGRYQAALTRHAGSNVEALDPEPSTATRVGEARLLAERYSLKVYNADFNDLWPRIQLLIPKDDPTMERLAAVRAQIDFSALSLMLTVTLGLVWLPLLIATSHRFVLFLIIGGCVPLVSRFLYEAVVQSQLALGGVVRSMVDKYRLEVLTSMLQQPLPASREAERQLWHRIRVAEAMPDVDDIPYRHPVKP